jgi:hypothetical protein
VKTRIVFAVALLAVLFILSGCKSTYGDGSGEGVVTDKGRDATEFKNCAYWLRVKDSAGKIAYVCWTKDDGPGEWSRYEVKGQYP